MPYFIDRIEDGQVQVSSHNGNTLRIGRGTNVEVRLNDPAVDLMHAEIVREDEGYVLSDQSSVLGVLVNGEKQERHLLRTGDKVGIGTYEITFEILSSAQPLFMHVALIGQEDLSTIGSATLGTIRGADVDSVGTFAGTLMLRTATMSTSGSQSLVEMAKAYAEAHDLPIEETGDIDGTVVDDIRSHVPSAPKEPPPPVEPLPEVDYASAYRLERGPLLRRSTAALILFLLGLGGVGTLVASGVRDVFSPGDITSAHMSVTGNDCQACHRPFRHVNDEGCLTSGCHATIGAHQESQIVDPDCLECHLEHSGLQALVFFEEERCVGCHQSLDAETLGKANFVANITDFTAETHPPFTPREDPGNLRFNHQQHVVDLGRMRGQEALECQACHERGEDGEILPVTFEQHCQRCHNLTFDARFGAQEAEHDTPAKVLNDMTGFYVQNRSVLRRLTGAEQDRLRGRNLNEEEKLAVVAEWNALHLVRTKCRYCHDFDARPGRGPLQDLNVEPTQIRYGWYDHAVFKHGPHLDLVAPDGTAGTSCTGCHPAVAASRVASDVLLAQIESCLPCHREPTAGEADAGAADDSNRGRTQCIACHTYHPEPGEFAQASTGSEGEADAAL